MTRGRVYDLNFGMYFLYMGCTRELCNRLGCTPICRDSRVNHNNVSQYISYYFVLNITPKPR